MTRKFFRLSVIAKPVRTLAVAIRFSRPLCKGITDSHDQSADWSRNDMPIFLICHCEASALTGCGNPFSLVLCARGITDSHDQSADWSRNDTLILSAFCHCEASANTGCGNPFPSSFVQGVLRIPTTSLRTGLGMTLKFFRLSVIAKPVRSLAVAIRFPRPLCMRYHGFPRQ